MSGVNRVTKAVLEAEVKSFIADMERAGEAAAGVGRKTESAARQATRVQREQAAAAKQAADAQRAGRKAFDETAQAATHSALVVGAALVVLVGLIWGFNAFRNHMIAQFFKNNKPPPTVVSVAEAKSEVLPNLLTGVGDLAAVQQVDVTADVSGRVTDILFTPGAHVKAGDPLIQLFDEPDRADLASYKAQTLADIKAELGQLMAEFNSLKAELVSSGAASTARTDAQKSGEVVREAVSAMGLNEEEGWSWEGLRNVMRLWYEVSKIELPGVPIKEIMVRDPTTVFKKTAISEAARIMRKNDFGQLPVRDNKDRLLAMIYDHDIISVLVKEQ